MKILFYITFQLLFTIATVAQSNTYTTKKENLYSSIKVNDSDCQYYYFGKQIYSKADWTGSCQDNYITGYGTLKIFRAESLIFTYEGEVNNGSLNGHGTFLWANGMKYIGEFKDGKKHGQGTMTMPNYSKYVGDFKNDHEHGQGTLTLANGCKYVGEFEDSYFFGQGTLAWTNGNKYIGRFEFSKFHGQGTFTGKEGRKYVGEYNYGKKHGQGTTTWVNGDKYVGEYNEGKNHGNGNLLLKDGTNTEGLWNENYMNTGDWDVLVRFVENRIQHKDSKPVNSFCWAIYLLSNDTMELNTAINWMKNMVQIDNKHWQLLDTYAALLYKTGQYDQALIWIDKAISMGKAKGDDVTIPEALREKIFAVE